MIDLEKLLARASGLPDSDGAIGPTWCTPTEVLELLDHIAALQDEVKEQCRINGMSAEREAALLSKVEQLDKDAGRYRWLRVQPNDATAPRIDICHWTCEDGDSVNTGEVLRGKDADQAIDTAMEASNAKTKR